MFPTFEMFCQVMDQCTENYECLVINNSAQSNKLTDQVFWYKADIRPNFKIGADPYWKYSENNYSNEEQQGGELVPTAKNPIEVTKLY